MKQPLVLHGHALETQRNGLGSELVLWAFMRAWRTAGAVAWWVWAGGIGVSVHPVLGPSIPPINIVIEQLLCSGHCASTRGTADSPGPFGTTF